jgi:putative transposase
MMPSYRRLFIPGGTYFFTVNLQNRRKAILIEQIDDLRASWREVELRRSFETIAAVVLPDHMHFVWRLPPEDQDFSTRIRLLKSSFTRRQSERLKSRARKGERNIWQSRFWEHAIRNAKDLDAHINYIHFNPVKHGYASNPDEWPYSTWRSWKRELGRPITIPPEDWRPLHLGER